MTQEEKAKRYDEAKARMSKAYNSNRCTIGFMNEIFPELKESKDIKKRIIDALHGDVLEMCEVKEAIDWLKNQGGHSDFLSKIQVGDKVTRNEDGILVNLSQLNRVAKKDDKQGEQKPADEVGNYDHKEVLQTIINEQNSAWSEEDEDNMMMIEDRLSDYLEYIREDTSLTKHQKNSMKEEVIGYVNGLKSLKDRVQSQPKQEWSEEDEKVLDGVITNYESGYLPSVEKRDEIIEKLKSLKERYTWKPSEKQKEALLWCVVHLGGADKQTLGELLEELNKL